MKHIFYMMNNNENKIENITNNYQKLSNFKKCELDDDFVQYIASTLNWIEAIWPVGKSKGLPYNGIAIIEKPYINKLKKILNSWKNLFMEAPSEIELYNYYDDEIMKNIYFNLNKEEIVNELTLLIDLLEMAEKEERNIFYSGV